MPELDKKATSVFAGKVVRKDLVRKVKVGANVPVFVLEYLQLRLNVVKTMCKSQEWVHCVALVIRTFGVVAVW